MNPRTPLTLSPGLRLACAAGACAVTVALGGGIAGLYDEASQPMWLVATPQVLAEIALCDREASFVLREQCRQDYVASRLPVEARWEQVAAR
jgi:hypothetical protein